jgi:hypothetical protein
LSKQTTRKTLAVQGEQKENTQTLLKQTQVAEVCIVSCSGYLCEVTLEQVFSDLTMQAAAFLLN